MGTLRSRVSCGSFDMSHWIATTAPVWYYARLPLGIGLARIKVSISDFRAVHGSLVDGAQRFETTRTHKEEQ